MPEEPDPRKLFDECVTACADSMFRVAFRLTGNRTAAEDLVQESYAEAWRCIESLRDVSRMRGWVFSILRNQHLKSRRQNHTFSTNEIESALQPNTDTEETEEQIDMVQEAIQQLEDSQRLPILLVSMEGLSVEEASDVLGLPKGTILSRMHRGRKKLKQIIERQQSAL